MTYPNCCCISSIAKIEILPIDVSHFLGDILYIIYFIHNSFQFKNYFKITDIGYHEKLVCL